MTKSVLKKLAIGLTIVVVLYTLAGLLLAPRLIRSKIEQYVSAMPGRSVALERISFNPFSLSIEIADLALIDPDEITVVSVDRLETGLRPIALLKGDLALRRLSLIRPRVLFEVFEDGDSRLSRLSADLPAETSLLSELEKIRIKRLDVTLGVLQVVDRSRQRHDKTPLEMEFADIELRMDDWSAASETHTSFKLATTVDKSAQVKSDGSFSLTDRAAEATVSVTGLDAGAVQAYVYAGIVGIASGRLNADTRVNYSDGSLEITGGMSVDDLVIAHPEKDEEILSAERAVMTGLVIDGFPLQASIDVAALRKPYVALRLDADHSLEFTAWMNTRDAAESDTGSVTLGLTVKRLEISDGIVDLIDARVAPPLELEAQRVQGAIANLTIDDSRVALIEMKGRLGQEGSVSLSGRARPLDSRVRSDGLLVLEGLDANILSPYAARYAGWQVNAGKLDLELNYRFSTYEVLLEHSAALEDLVLGDRLDGTDRGESLPLDLAVALLQDREGRIEIGFQASGNPGDPSFDLYARIASALDETLTALTDDPFRILSGLSGAPREALDTVAFDPGRADISLGEVERLAVLSKALAERPALKLVPVGGYDPQSDRAALARLQVRQHIALASSAAPDELADPGPVIFTDPRTQGILDEFATSRLDEKTLSALNADGAGAAYYQAVFDKLVANEKISDKSLETLARYRAQAIKQQMTRFGIDAERIEIAEDFETVRTEDKQVRLSLRLKGDRSIF